MNLDEWSCGRILQILESPLTRIQWFLFQGVSIPPAGYLPQLCSQRKVRERSQSAAHRIHGRLRGGDIRPRPGGIVRPRLHAHQGAGGTAARGIGQ